MRRGPIASLFAATLLIAGCGRQPSAGLSVTDAWVRLPAVAGRPGAAYFLLCGGAAPSRLATIESPAAARAELHEGGMHDGMMTMRPIDGIDVPAKQCVEFAPGRNHVMLFGLDPALKPGGAMPLRFRFQDGASTDIDAHLIGAGDPAPPRLMME